jgi:hypothetical protein
MVKMKCYQRNGNSKMVTAKYYQKGTKKVLSTKWYQRNDNSKILPTKGTREVLPTKWYQRLTSEAGFLKRNIWSSAVQ